MNNFFLILIISASILLQLGTAIYAFYLFRLTGKKPGWILISIAFVLMIFRRILALSVYFHDKSLCLSINNELVGLIISLLMFIGTLAIKSFFEIFLENQKKLKISREKLNELNKTKDKMISIISHDLKSPFNTLISFSLLLLDNIEQYSKEKIRDFLIRINQSAKKGLFLMENLLNWSRTQLGKIEIYPENIDLLEVISENIMFLELSIQQKNINIENKIKNPFNVITDRNIISLVIRNLLSNAIKFSYIGGKIVISVTSKNDVIELSIADNGTGIEKSRIADLFTTGKNISTPGTDNESGTGIGLPICHDFLNRIGADIKVVSEPGKGTIFTILLKSAKINGNPQTN